MNYQSLQIDSYHIENESQGHVTKKYNGFQLSINDPNSWVGVKLEYDFENKSVYSIKFDAYSEKSSSLLEIWGWTNEERIRVESLKINPQKQTYEILFTEFGSKKISLVFSSAGGFPTGSISIENMKIAYLYQVENTGIDCPTGSHHYRAFVAHPTRYDLVGANQFNLLTVYGLREYHYLLDIGCGSLNGGRLFIPYLLPKRYFGIEPEQWLVEDGIKNNLGKDIINIKQPQFSNDKNFTCSVFNRKFDFILAHSIFSHASPTQIKRCLSEVNKIMHQNSLFLFSFMKSDENHYEDKWIYPDCWTYTEEFMTTMITENKLFCKPSKWPHSGHQTWMVVVKQPDNIPEI